MACGSNYPRLWVCSSTCHLLIGQSLTVLAEIMLRSPWKVLFVIIKKAYLQDQSIQKNNNSILKEKITADGQVEKANNTLEEMLLSYVKTCRVIGIMVAVRGIRHQQGSSLRYQGKPFWVAISAHSDVNPRTDAGWFLKSLAEIKQKGKATFLVASYWTENWWRMVVSFVECKNGLLAHTRSVSGRWAFKFFLTLHFGHHL